MTCLHSRGDIFDGEVRGVMTCCLSCRKLTNMHARGHTGRIAVDRAVACTIHPVLTDALWLQTPEEKRHLLRWWIAQPKVCLLHLRSVQAAPP